MRITFVMPFMTVEGGSRVVATYARMLSARGHVVRVVSCGRPRWPVMRHVRHRAKLALRGRFADLLVPYGPTHFDGLEHLHTRIPGTGPVSARHVPDADVIVATWWETAEWVAAMPAQKGAKVHLIQHDEREFSEDPALRARVEATWRLPDFSRVVVAGWLRELGRSEFGVESVLVNNAVDTQLFCAPPRERNAVPTFGLMYHARPFKGTDVSLRAFALARARRPEIRLKAFGSSKSDERVPLPADVPMQVRPAQPEIAAFYRSCDAYLFGSRREGFGLPILEAMACRTPVIGTPTGAAPELIAERGGGILVKMEDPESMAEAIEQVATMPPERWRAMSDAAAQTAARHTWEEATRQFEAALAEAAGAKGSVDRA